MRRSSLSGSIFWFLSLGLLVAGVPDPVQGDIFRFEDDGGVIHFTNVPTETKYRLYLREYQKSQSPGPGRANRKISFPPLIKASQAELPFIENQINEASQSYGVDPKLIQAVIQVESNFNPSAVSPKGAQGLMQLMPQTARDLQVNDPFHPGENIHGGTRYLRYLMDLFNNELPLVLAAYNAGPEKVNLHRGIPPYLETRNYVQKVTQLYNRLKVPMVSSR